LSSWSSFVLARLLLENMEFFSFDFPQRDHYMLCAVMKVTPYMRTGGGDGVTLYRGI
jgi:hypothetical protein